MEGPEEAKKNQEEVKPEILGFTVQGIRETRSQDLLVELRCSSEGRGQLDAAFKEAVGDNETVRHLIPPIEVKTKDLEPSIAVKDVEDVVRRFL